MTTPAGVILAGGASSRMGRDKALVEIDGRPMILHVAQALSDGGCSPVWCQGGDAVRLGRLGFEVVPDPVGPADAPGRSGPVPAIATALANSTAATVVVAACDLPDLTRELVRSLVRVSMGTGAVAVATSDGRRHLVAAWPTAVLPELAGLIEQGVTAYGAALAQLGAVDVEAASDVLRNVNLPSDLLGRGPGNLGRR